MISELTNTAELKQVLEVALLTTREPLSLDDMQRLFVERIERSTLRMLLDELKADWQARTMELVNVASGWRFQARAQFAPFLARLNPDKQARFSRAALETLAIIAYRQPVTRGDIEDIRGVAVNPNIMRQLQEREWIDIVGQRDVPGRPSLYATTKRFLDDLNLHSLAQLPNMENFAQVEMPLEAKPLDLQTEDLSSEDELSSDSLR